MATTPIDNFFFDKLLRRLHPSDAMVYLVIWRLSYGVVKPTVKISIGELARYTGLSMTTVQTSLKSLLEAKLLARRRESATAITEYQVKRPWRKKPSTKNSAPVSSK
jgi:DNA-binding transcriptional ArsR family regulator